jgi:phenylpropionate dioxygenase-like ring-hydroxylating dioxygenase large terminal subunit
MSAEWEDVLAAADVGPGQIRGVTLGGEDLVVWRTLDGRLCAMDARCPHQWSHLEAEGVVDGSEVVCTAHYWRFDADGRASKLAMSGRRDPKAAIATYGCRESDGRIEVGPSTRPEPEGGSV